MLKGWVEFATAQFTSETWVPSISILHQCLSIRAPTMAQAWRRQTSARPREHEDQHTARGMRHESWCAWIFFGTPQLLMSFSKSYWPQIQSLANTEFTRLDALHTSTVGQHATQAHDTCKARAKIIVNAWRMCMPKKKCAWAQNIAYSPRNQRWQGPESGEFSDIPTGCFT